MTDNNSSTDKDSLKWQFECGFQLKNNGAIFEIDNEFFPPTTGYCSTWEAHITILSFGEEIHEKRFYEETFEALKKSVEEYVLELRDKLVNLF